MAIIKGNIGGDIKKIESKKSDGKPFYSFNLAENNGKDRDPTWYEVTAFVDEVAGDMLEKGMWVEIVGRIEAHSYPKKDGSPGASIRLTTGKVTVVEPAKK